MYFGMSCLDKRVNDFSLELIAVYELVRDRDKHFIKCLNDMADTWDMLGTLADEYSLELYKDGDDERLLARCDHVSTNLLSTLFTDELIDDFMETLKVTLESRIRRLRTAEYPTGFSADELMLSLEAAFKAGFYEHVKAVYNKLRGQLDPIRLSCYYFLRKYCYGGIYRRNNDGDFTTPFAGGAAALSLPDIETEYWTNSDLTCHLMQTEFDSVDFLEFLRFSEPKVHDFIYLDPPQTSRSTAYTNYKFGMSDHERLADWLVNHCEAQWLLFLNPDRRIETLYRGKRGIHMNYFDEGFDSRSNFKTDKTRSILVKNY